MAAFRQKQMRFTKSGGLLVSAPKVGLRWFGRAARYAGSWYIMNIAWSLAMLVDQSPIGLTVLKDPQKVAGALLLRHFFPLLKGHPMLGGAIFLFALVLGHALNVVTSGRMTPNSQVGTGTVGECNSAVMKPDLEREVAAKLEPLQTQVQSLSEQIRALRLQVQDLARRLFV